MSVTLSLAQLRAAVRGRIHLSPNDPAFGDQVVNRAVSMAMGDVANADPNGWWFQRFELTAQNTAGDVSVFPVNMIDRARTVEKIHTVFVSLDGNYWLQVDQHTVRDSVLTAGGRTAAAGIPVSWAQQRLPITSGPTQHNDMGVRFAPQLPNGAWVRCEVAVGPADFVDDADLMDGLPFQFAGAVIEGAALKLARQQRKQGVLTSRRRTITAATMCQSAYQDWLKILRAWFDRPYAGPGYPTERDR